jgi:hypothetical protein
LLTLALQAGADGGAAALTAGGGVAGAGGDACRRALAALALLGRAERARVLAVLMHRASAAVPPGLEQVHPGWLRRALEGEATELLLAVTDGLAAPVRAVAGEIIAARGDDSVSTAAAGATVAASAPACVDQLRRAVFASFVPMPSAAEAARADAPEWMRLAALPLVALAGEIDRRGAAVLGTSLAGSPPAVVARAAAGAGGGAAAAALLEAARRVPAADERDRARALVSAAATLSVAGELTSVQAVGLCALADALAAVSRDAVRALAQRLPPRLGEIVLERAIAPDGGG